MSTMGKKWSRQPQNAIGCLNEILKLPKEKKTSFIFYQEEDTWSLFIPGKFLLGPPQS